MVNIKDKIKGMILGVYIGDTMGIAVEGFSKEKIKQKYGRIKAPQDPSEHPVFKGLPIGTWSDDTHFTLAIADSIIRNKELNMDSIAFHHILSASTLSCGMGGTTKRAIANLINGKYWTKSGEGADDEIGNGNGPAMKVSPLAAYAVLKDYKKAKDYVYSIGKMTHVSSNSIHTSMVIFDTLVYCLLSNNENFSKNELYNKIIEKPDYPVFDKLHKRLVNINQAENFSDEQIIEMNNGGGFYAIDSIPFSLMFFYRNPFSFETVLDVVNAGGDVDTNASIVAAMIGALNGPSIFPEHIIQALPQDKIKLINTTSSELYRSLV